MLNVTRSSFRRSEAMKRSRWRRQLRWWYWRVGGGWERRFYPARRFGLVITGAITISSAMKAMCPAGPLHYAPLYKLPSNHHPPPIGGGKPNSNSNFNWKRASYIYTINISVFYNLKSQKLKNIIFTGSRWRIILFLYFYMIVIIMMEIFNIFSKFFFHRR